MKRTIYILVALASLVFASCSNDEPDTNQFGESLAINAFGPCPVNRGDEIRIIGSCLDMVNAVRFPGDIDVTDFNLVSPREIICTVPNEATAGHLQLVSRDGSVVKSITVLSYIEPIEVKELTPVTGLKAGDIITVRGEYVGNIANVVFAENVAVYAEDFVSVSRNEISVAVPKAAVSGKVTFSDGASIPTLIEWDTPLEIAEAKYTGISATEVVPGQTVTVKGSNLDLIASVTFPGCTPTEEFTVSELADELTAIVPANAKAGAIILTQYSGRTLVSDEITVPVATVSAINPAENLKAGDMVTVTGEKLNLIVKVVVPGNIEVPYNVNGDGSELSFIVPDGMGDGCVSLYQSESIVVETPRISMHVEIDETVIWNGTWENTSWGGMQDLAWGGYDWSTFKEGQQIAFYLITCGAGAALKPSDSSWTELSCGFISLEPSDELQRIVITPDADDIAKLRQNGMVVSGNNFILKMITIP